MSFEIQTLTKTDDEFFKDAEKTPTTVEGSGQMVYWRNSFIKEYKTGSTEKPIKEYDVCDGEGMVRKGMSLLFGGRDGQVKEDI